MFFSIGWVLLWRSRIWYFKAICGHVMHGDINSKKREVTKLEITGKRKNGQPRKLWEEYVKKEMKQHGLRREDAYNKKKMVRSN